MYVALFFDMVTFSGWKWSSYGKNIVFGYYLSMAPVIGNQIKRFITEFLF